MSWRDGVIGGVLGGARLGLARPGSRLRRESSLPTRPGDAQARHQLAGHGVPLSARQLAAGDGQPAVAVPMHHHGDTLLQGRHGLLAARVEPGGRREERLRRRQRLDRAPTLVPPAAGGPFPLASGHRQPLRDSLDHVGLSGAVHEFRRRARTPTSRLGRRRRSRSRPPRRWSATSSSRTTAAGWPSSRSGASSSSCRRTARRPSPANGIPEVWENLHGGNLDPSGGHRHRARGHLAVL